MPDTSDAFRLQFCLLFLPCFYVIIATMTAALSNTGTLSSLLPLLSATNKPPSVEAHPDVCVLEEVKRKVSKRANKISIKQFTDVRILSHAS